ncbi:coiled-coil domain-containing protein 146 isoform 2-T2 [Synchiropus picturatus]
MHSELEEERPPVDGHAAAISTSFRLLEQLLLSEKISPSAMATLKSKLTFLCDSLRRSQDSEVRLLQEAQRLHSEVRNVQEELEGLEEQTETEADHLRRQLLDAHNQLRAAEEQEQQNRVQILCLQEEKKWLLDGSLRESDPTRTSNLQEQNQLLREDVALSRAEFRRLTEELLCCETEIQKEQTLLEEVKQQECVSLLNSPKQIVEKDSGSERRKAAVREIEVLDQQISGLEQQLKKLQDVSVSLKSRRTEAQEQLKELLAQVEVGEGRCRCLEKEIQRQQEEEAELTGNRGILELKLCGSAADRRLLQERLCVLRKEKSRLREALKTVERSVMISSEQLQLTLSHTGRLQDQLDLLRCPTAVHQRAQLQREVDALVMQLVRQVRRCGGQSLESQEQLEAQVMLKRSDRLREEIQHLTSLRHLRAEERNLKHRELLRVQGTLRNLDVELGGKDQTIQDQKKLDSCLRRRSSEYGKLSELMDAERNKLVDLKQVAAHSTTELTQQLGLLEHQVEIQRSILDNKESLHCKAQMKISNNSKTREHLQNLLSQTTWKLRHLTQMFEDHRAEVRGLRRSVELQERVLLDLSKNQEVSVQRRNTLGVQLLEQEDVVASCYERLKIQEEAVMKGSLSLELLEKESRELRPVLDDERRKMELKEKEVPLSRRLEEEITLLQIQLLEARAETLQAVDQTSEYKEVNGSNHSTPELIRKVEQLERSLTRRERHLLEKRLLVEQVTRLTTPLAGQVEKCRQERLGLAQKLNELRSGLLSSSDRLMSVSAQLSMKQAALFSLQQEIREKEVQLDTCRCRLDRGLPPCPEVEEEWRKMLRDRRRRLRDKEEQQKRAQQNQWYQLPSGERTTAEPRPNAYIPQTEGLPLPRPYGALAPVKPWQPTAAPRHPPPPPNA